MFVGKVEKPPEGWTAFFVEMTFDAGVTFPLKMTSGVRIVPETLPFRTEDPAKGKLEVQPRR